jgi:sulfite exporter TauE/SafE
MMLYLSAFITGLISSMHCASMCGPIAFALPKTGNGLQGIAIGRLLYNFGRITTYAFLGLAFGLFGQGLKFAGFQQSVSIMAGVFMLAGALTAIFKKKPVGSGYLFKFLSSKFIKKLFNGKDQKSLFGIGLINGFLPCGFVYFALIGASVTQHAWHGALYMALFGVGTLPLMYIISMAGHIVAISVRNKFNRLIPYLAILMGFFFIVRGLNLGIPYVSPKINIKKPTTEICE